MLLEVSLTWRPQTQSASLALSYSSKSKVYISDRPIRHTPSVRGVFDPKRHETLFPRPYKGESMRTCSIMVIQGDHASLCSKLTS